MSVSDVACPDISAGLSVSGLSAWYGSSQVLHDVSFTLSRGDLCALVGVNGAGKSTLFKAIMGMVHSQGICSFAGEGLPVARKAGLVGYVPQSEDIDVMFPLRVRDVVMMGRYCHLGFTRRPSKHDRDTVEDALGRVGLSDLADRPLSQLSGGQRKRVFVARGIAQQARLMLLDEPFAGVDKRSEGIICDLLASLASEGTIILVAIHDLRMAREFFDRCLAIDGTIIAQGSAKEVLGDRNLLESFGLSEGGIGTAAHMVPIETGAA